MGESISAILIKYDTVIRSIEVKKSDGTVMKLGEEDPLHLKDYQTEIINFTNGEEIVGVFGMIEHDKKTAGVANHFVSMGFITNQCENTNLQQMSHKDGIGRRGGRGNGDRQNKTILVSAVIVLSIIVFVFCTYCILKKRGMICKKKSQADAQTIEHHAVSNDSTAKKQPQNRIPVSQDSMYNSTTTPNAVAGMNINDVSSFNDV